MRACYDDITVSGGRIVDVYAFLERAMARADISESQRNTAEGELKAGRVYIAPDASWSLTPLPDKPRAVLEARKAALEAVDSDAFFDACDRAKP